VHKIETAFTVRDRVHVDGCKDLVGVVTAVHYRNPQQVCYEVSWVCGGKPESTLIEGWRLTDVEKR